MTGLEAMLSPQSQGAYAFIFGDDESANPYKTSDPRYAQWLAGYTYQQLIGDSNANEQ